MTNHYERLLDLATAAHGNVEVFGVESSRRHVEFEANRPKNIGQRQSSGIALRIINKDGRIGFSSTSDTEKIDELVDRTGALAVYGAEAKFQFPNASDYPHVESVDGSAAAVTDEEMLNFGRSAIDAILTEFPEALCSADFQQKLRATAAHQLQRRRCSTRPHCMQLLPRSRTHPRYRHAQHMGRNSLNQPSR